MTKQELQEEIRNLYRENLMLRDLVAKLEEQQKNMEVSLSLEETIQAFRDMEEAESGKPRVEFNPFGSLFGAAGGNGGNADTRMNPDAFPENGEAYLDQAGESVTDTGDMPDP